MPLDQQVWMLREHNDETNTWMNLFFLNMGSMLICEFSRDKGREWEMRRHYIEGAINNPFCLWMTEPPLLSETKTAGMWYAQSLFFFVRTCTTFTCTLITSQLRMLFCEWIKCVTVNARSTLNYGFHKHLPFVNVECKCECNRHWPKLLKWYKKPIPKCLAKYMAIGAWSKTKPNHMDGTRRGEVGLQSEGKS